jgi:hypothetical protein
MEESQGIKATAGVSAELAILQVALDGEVLWPVAILLLDADDKLHIRQRADLAAKLSGDDAEVVTAYLADLRDDGRFLSGDEILAKLEDSLSNALRITDRSPVLITATIDAALDEFSRQHLSPQE